LAKSKLAKTIIATLLAWALIVVVYAIAYVTTTLKYPNLEGYEAFWSFQLFFFCLTRLPLLLLALMFVLLIEMRLIKSET
jgi:hypothetical protein